MVKGKAQGQQEMSHLLSVLHINSKLASPYWSMQPHWSWSTRDYICAAEELCRSQRGRGGAAHISGEVPSGGAESLRGACHGSVQVFEQRLAHPPRHRAASTTRDPSTTKRQRHSAKDQKNFNLTISSFRQTLQTFYILKFLFVISIL